MKARLRLALAASAAIVLSGALAATANAGFNTCGDPSNDGVANAIDALYILQYDAGLLDLPGPALSMADVDSNAQVTARDALLILQYDAGLVPALECVP
jgi:hypothetical protein